MRYKKEKNYNVIFRVIISIYNYSMYKKALSILQIKVLSTYFQTNYLIFISLSFCERRKLSTYVEEASENDLTRFKNPNQILLWGWTEFSIILLSIHSNEASSELSRGKFLVQRSRTLRFSPSQIMRWTTPLAAFDDVLFKLKVLKISATEPKSIIEVEAK